jgi:hypothetical protein
MVRLGKKRSETRKLRNIEQHYPGYWFGWFKPGGGLLSTDFVRPCWTQLSGAERGRLHGPRCYILSVLLVKRQRKRSSYFIGLYGDFIASPLSLKITRSNTFVILSWPANALNFQLPL